MQAITFECFYNHSCKIFANCSMIENKLKRSTMSMSLTKNMHGIEDTYLLIKSYPISSQRIKN